MLDSYYAQCRQNVNLLEEAFQIIGEEKKTEKCKATAGIIDEWQDIVNKTEKGMCTRDVGLIFAAQKALHYQIATYDGFVELAHALEHSNVAEILEQPLSEGKHTDASLTHLAVSEINDEACKELKTK